MCIEMCAQVVSRERDSVAINRDGRLLRASTLLMPDIDVGDWVLVTAGTVVERLDPDEAQQVNKLLHDARERLQ